MIERIYLQEISGYFPYKDIRTIISWCNKNKVALLKDSGSRSRYAIRKEFEAALDKEPINLITQKYGKSPEEIRAGINLYSELRSSLEESNQVSMKKLYKPRGLRELDFLSRLLLISKK